MGGGGDPHVQGASRALVAVGQLEVLAGNNSVEEPGDAFLYLPAEDFAVERVSRVYVVGREVYEYEGVWVSHVVHLGGLALGVLEQRS